MNVSAEDSGTPERQESLRKDSFAEARPMSHDRRLRRARSHTRRVWWLKRALPVLAFAILASAGLYAFNFKASNDLTISFAELRQENGEVQVIKPRVMGRDGQGRPYVVKAAEIRQQTGTDRAELIAAEAELNANTPEALRATARTGMYNSTAERLFLDGGIFVAMADGTEMTGTSLDVDLKSGDIQSAEPVTAVFGRGAGWITGQRLTIREDGTRIRLDGGVRFQWTAERGNGRNAVAIPQGSLFERLWPQTAGASGSLGETLAERGSGNYAALVTSTGK